MCSVPPHPSQSNLATATPPQLRSLLGSYHAVLIEGHGASDEREPEGVARVQRMQQVYRDGAARMAAVAAKEKTASSGTEVASSHSGRALALQLRVPCADTGAAGTPAGPVSESQISAAPAAVQQGAVSIQNVTEPLRKSSSAAVAVLDSLNDSTCDAFSDTDSINEGEVDELLAWTNGLGDAI